MTSLMTNTVFGGTYFARSGVTAHGQSNVLSITRGMRADVARFSFKVSTEAIWDRFDFFSTGRICSAEPDCRIGKIFTFNVPAGTNTVAWHVRDGANDGNQDAVFIDNVDIPLREAVNTNVLVSLNTNAMRFVNEKFQIRVEGQTNQVYRIQRSIDLANWITVATNYAPFGTSNTRTCLPSSNQSIQFYRVRTD